MVNGHVLSANQTLRSKQLVHCTNTYKVKENAICFDKTQHEGLKRTPFIWIKTKHADSVFFSNVCVFSSWFRALYIAVIFASSVVADGGGGGVGGGGGGGGSGGDCGGGGGSVCLWGGVVHMATEICHSIRQYCAVCLQR